MAGKTPDSLREIELLRSVSDADLATLEKQCAWHSYKSKEEILAQNSDSMDVFFVVKGTVQVVNFSLSGREIAYAKVGKGSYFGELAAIDKKPRSTSVVAASPCRLASLSPTAFEALLRAQPEVSWQVMNKLTQIIRANDERIMDLSTLDAHQRIYIELLRLSKPDPVAKDRWMIYPLPTQQDIASLVSTTRETVARAISQLSSTGLVQRKGRTLYITDKDKLTDLSRQLASKS